MTHLKNSYLFPENIDLFVSLATRAGPPDARSARDLHAAAAADRGRRSGRRPLKVLAAVVHALLVLTEKTTEAQLPSAGVEATHPNRRTGLQ
ncbi:hypothetical protein [Streptomyces sp. NPDC126514]|uniref:hypothetical protein n=1 Tax=Streptomyces sp. NPDC126514 TaxID=3155210 RepID=UPI00332430AF